MADVAADSFARDERANASRRLTGTFVNRSMRRSDHQHRKSATSFDSPRSVTNIPIVLRFIPKTVWLLLFLAKSRPFRMTIARSMVAVGFERKSLHQVTCGIKLQRNGFMKYLQIGPALGDAEKHFTTFNFVQM